MTVSGVTAENKMYDGTDTATLNLSGVALQGVVCSEGVELVTTGYTATFDSKHVGTGKSVTVSGFTLSGDDKDNYTLKQPTGVTASITVRPITVTAVNYTKVYDGTTTGTDRESASPRYGVPTFVLGGTDALAGTTTLPGTDTSGFVQRFDTRHVGELNKVLTPEGGVVDGNDGDNYSYTFNTYLYGTVTPRAITATAVAYAKVYDGTVRATDSASEDPRLGLPTYEVELFYSGEGDLLNDDDLFADDSPSFYQEFATKHVVRQRRRRPWAWSSTTTRAPTTTTRISSFLPAP